MSRGFAKLAGVLSLFQAFLYIILVLTLFLLTHNQQQLYFIILFSSFILLALIGFTAVAPATSLLFFEAAPDWSMMGKNIALLCLSVTILYFSWILINYTNQQNKDFLNLLTIFQWVGWFTFGGLGVWVLIVGLLTLITQKLPKTFILPCIIKALGFWIILIGIVTNNLIIAQAGVILGALIGGPWYHGILGYYLWKNK